MAVEIVTKGHLFSSNKAVARWRPFDCLFSVKMSVSKSKDLVCLLAAVVSEMLDDSDDDEELMPLKAVLDAREVVHNEEPPTPTKLKTKPKPANDIDKYSRPSRFEDPAIFQPPTTVDVEELICKTSLKPATQCFCTYHINLQSLSLFSLLVINQIGGESLTDIGKDFFINQICAFSLFLDFQANWHMSKGTVEALYQILFNNSSESSVSAMEFLAFLWSLATNETAEYVKYLSSVRFIPLYFVVR